jgi:hypothetical protein
MHIHVPVAHDAGCCATAAQIVAILFMNISVVSDCMIRDHHARNGAEKHGKFAPFGVYTKHHLR